MPRPVDDPATVEVVLLQRGKAAKDTTATMPRAEAKRLGFEEKESND